MTTYFNFAFAIIILLFISSCTKEPLELERQNTPVLLSFEENANLAQKYARSQNFMNNFLINSFAGAVAQPEFYGFSLTPTAVPCPSTQLSENGEILSMQFGENVNETCESLNFNEVGGLLELDKNFTKNISETRECQPGKFLFDQLSVEGSLISSSNDSINPLFYAIEGCDVVNNGFAPDETLNFSMKVANNWEMSIKDLNGDESIFHPIENTFGSFLNINAPDVFVNDMNFQDLYLADFQLKMLNVEDKYNLVTLKNAGEKGEDIQYSVITTKDLVYKAYTCNFIIDGTLILGDIYGKPLVGIDYSAGENDTNNGECDSFVKICPANDNGTLNFESSDCFVVDCLSY